MKQALLFILLFCAHSAKAQVITFQNNYGADTTHEEGRVVIQTADSGYFVCGQRLLDTGYIGQGLLMRTDKFGNELWTNYYTHTGASHLRFDDMIMTSDGNLVVTGQAYYNVSDIDVYLAKLDTAGNILWEKNLGGVGRQYCSGVKETPDGGLVISGSYDSSTAAIPEFYLLRTNSDGDSLWSRTYSNEKEQFAHSIAVTNDSGFVMVGHIRDLSQLAGQTYVVRTDKNGDTLWTRTLTILETGQAVQVRVKPNGSIVLVGSSSALSWGPKPMMAELDDAGNLVWFQLYYNATLGHLYSLSATNDGGFILSGHDTTGNFYVIKTNDLGQQQWIRLIDESPSDWGYEIIQTNDGGYVFTGTAVYDNPFNPDVMLIKLDENGNLSSQIAKMPAANFSVYPNPGKDMVYIRNTSGEQLQAIELYDLSGRLVHIYDAGKQSINVSGVSRGVYMLRLMTASGVMSSKLVIE
jgi:hypothetical protein